MHTTYPYSVDKLWKISSTSSFTCTLPGRVCIVISFPIFFPRAHRLFKHRRPRYCTQYNQFMDIFWHYQFEKRIQVTKMNNVDAMAKCKSPFENFNRKIDKMMFMSIINEKRWEIEIWLKKKVLAKSLSSDQKLNLTMRNPTISWEESTITMIVMSQNQFDGIANERDEIGFLLLLKCTAEWELYCLRAQLVI